MYQPERNRKPMHDVLHAFTSADEAIAGLHQLPSAVPDVPTPPESIDRQNPAIILMPKELLLYEVDGILEQARERRPHLKFSEYVEEGWTLWIERMNNLREYLVHARTVKITDDDPLAEWTQEQEDLKDWLLERGDPTGSAFCSVTPVDSPEHEVLFWFGIPNLMQMLDYEKVFDMGVIVAIYPTRQDRIEEEHEPKGWSPDEE